MRSPTATRACHSPPWGILLFGLMILSLCGCSSLEGSSARRYSTLPIEESESFAEARKENSKGLRAFEHGGLEKAEKHFQEALVSEGNFGPAHNNLGHIYLATHRLYLAAWEFELAANLMPGRVEPLLNQGLVYELAGRFDRAADFYTTAYSMAPQHAEVIGYLARLRVKEDGEPTEINFLLQELVLYDSRPDWIAWAQELLATKYSAELTGTVEIPSTTILRQPFDGPENPLPGNLPGSLQGPELLPTPHGVKISEQSVGAEGKFYDMPPPNSSAARAIEFDEILKVER